MQRIKPNSLRWSNPAIEPRAQNCPNVAQRTVAGPARGAVARVEPRVSQTARLTLSAIVMLALIGAAPALAQSRAAAPAPHGENLSAGKTPAQLFASDCSACHRSPAGLARGRGPGQLANFLLEHYTSSRQSAGLLGSYVASMRGPAPAAPGRTQPAGPERPTATAGPRPLGEMSETEPPGGPVLLQEERPGANGRQQRPATAATRGRAQPAQAAHRPEAATEPEARAESPSAPKTLDTLEVYD